MDVEDQLLIIEIKNRNQSVFEDFFHRYYNELTLFAEGMVFDIQLANDIVQNVFIRVWEIANTLNINTPMKPYIYRAVKNRCLNYLRDTRTHDKHNFLYWQDISNACTSEDEPCPELMGHVRNSLDSLPTKMAEIFKLKYLEERKHRDIAETLCISENTVKTQLLRGKTKLKKILVESAAVL